MNAASFLRALPTPTRSKCSLVVLLVLGTCLSFSSSTCSAADTLRIVVPFAAGGGGDRLARLLAPELSSELGAAVVVENAPGGNGVVGMQRVKRAAPHEHLVVLASEHAAVIAPLVVPSAGFETHDFIAVGVAATFPYVVAVAENSGPRTLHELRSVVHRKSSLSIAVPAEGGAPELIANALGAPGLTVVPFRGGQPATVALVGGQVDAAAVGVSNVLSLYSSGKVRVLAVTGPARVPAMPEVPTFSESGVAGLGMTSGWILLAHKNTPLDVDALNQALAASLSRDHIKATMRQLGMEGSQLDARESTRELERLHSHWEQLVGAQARPIQ